MAMKAVKITTENVNYLKGRFLQDPEDDTLIVGRYLITLFGSEDADKGWDVITEDTLEAVYVRVEPEMRNNFFEIRLRN